METNVAGTNRKTNKKGRLTAKNFLPGTVPMAKYGIFTIQLKRIIALWVLFIDYY